MRVLEMYWNMCMALVCFVRNTLSFMFLRWCLVSLAVTDKLTWHHYNKSHILTSIFSIKWSNLKSLLSKSWYIYFSALKQDTFSFLCELSSMSYFTTDPRVNYILSKWLMKWLMYMSSIKSSTSIWWALTQHLPQI